MGMPKLEIHVDDTAITTRARAHACVYKETQYLALYIGYPTIGYAFADDEDRIHHGVICPNVRIQTTQSRAVFFHSAQCGIDNLISEVEPDALVHASPPEAEDTTCFLNAGMSGITQALAGGYGIRSDQESILKTRQKIFGNWRIKPQDMLTYTRRIGFYVNNLNEADAIALLISNTISS